MSVLAPGDAEAAVAGLGGGWPVHEVGRNADVFNPDAGKLLRAGSRVGFPNVHMHANGKDTTGHLEVGVQVPSEGLQAEGARAPLPDRHRRHRHPRRCEAGQEGRGVPDAHAADEDHGVRAAHARGGVRMCLDAICGSRVETLSCSGYDHSWVRAYQYEDDAAPLLPRGTILRVTGYYDNTPANRNVVDPRNWSGLGHRSIDNMNILIMQAVTLTDETVPGGGRRPARAARSSSPARTLQDARCARSRSFRRRARPLPTGQQQ